MWYECSVDRKLLDYRKSKTWILCTATKRMKYARVMNERTQDVKGWMRARSRLPLTNDDLSTGNDRPTSAATRSPLVSHWFWHTSSTCKQHHSQVTEVPLFHNDLGWVPAGASESKRSLEAHLSLPSVLCSMISMRPSELCVHHNYNFFKLQTWPTLFFPIWTIALVHFFCLIIPTRWRLSIRS